MNEKVLWAGLRKKGGREAMVCLGRRWRSSAKLAPVTTFLKIFIYLFIYLFLAALGLRCCVQVFSSCGEWGLLFVAVHGLLIVVAPLVAEHGL